MKLFRIYLIFFCFILICERFVFADTAAEKTVAIMYFEDKSIKQELGFLERAFTQMLITDLSNVKGLHVVERERVEKFLEEIDLSELGVIDEETRQKAGEALGADYLVMGVIEGYSGISPFAITINIQEVKTQKIFAPKTIAGNVKQTIEVEKRLIAIISEALGVDTTVKKSIKLPVKTKTKIPLAVMRFQNNSFNDKLDPLQEGFADLMTEDLAHVNQLKIVDRESIYKILKEVELTLFGLTDKANCIKIGRMLGAEIMLMGSFVETGETLRLDSHLIDVDTGRLLKADSVSGNTKEFYKLEKNLVSKIVSNLDVVLSKKEKEQIAQVATKSVESLIYYSKGRESYSKWDFTDAVGWYNKAIYIDPDFFKARWNLASVYNHELRDYQKAVSHYEKILHRSDLSEHNKWSVLYSLGQLYRNLDKEKAIRTLKMVVSECPIAHHRAWSAYCLGKFYYDKAKSVDDYKCAAKWLQKAIDLCDPKISKGMSDTIIRQARFYRVLIYKDKLHNPAMMLKEQAKQLGQFPEGPNANKTQFWIGVFQDSSGEYKKALESFQKLVDKFPSDELYTRPSEAQSRIANIYVKLKDHRRALCAQQKLINNYPSYFGCSDAQYQIGSIYENHFKNIDKAIDAYKKCVVNYSKYDPSGKRAWNKLQSLKVTNIGSDGRTKILLDEKHGQYRSSNICPLSHYMLIKILRQNNFIVHENRSMELTPELLKSYSVLILNGGQHEKRFSEQELEAIKRFINNGGSVFVGIFRGARPTLERSDKLYNPLIYQFGCVVKDFKRLGSYNKDRGSYGDIELEEHPITAGIEKIWIAATVAIDTTSIVPLIKCDKKNILCAGTYGRGKLVVSSLGLSFTNYGLSSANPLSGQRPYDMKYSSQIYKNNKKLLLSIVNWLGVELK